MSRPRTNITKKYTLPTGWTGGFFRVLYGAGIVEVPGLGTFSLVDIKERRTFHNFSGAEITLPGYKRLKFTQSPSVKGRITGFDTISAPVTKI